MNLVLIGYRGSGKTTVGRILAWRRGVPFIDTDDLTCQRFGIDSIARIWQEYGEPEFRRVECQVVDEVMRADEQVIGLGGGTLMQAPARRAVEACPHAACVYLQCDAAVLQQRIEADARSQATRPNLTQHGGGLREIIVMLEQRQPVYRAVAHHMLDASELSPDQLADRIERLL